jgi:tetratricopeptide (TPR) repeat protein
LRPPLPEAEAEHGNRFLHARHVLGAARVNCGPPKLETPKHLFPTLSWKFLALVADKNNLGLMNPLLRIGVIVPFSALAVLATSAQTVDEEAIKKAVRAETEAFYKSDAEAWEATWLHEDNCTRTIVSNNSYGTITGWNNFGPEMIKLLKQRKPIPLELKLEKYIIRTDAHLAWVEYDQYMNQPGADPKTRRFSREYRVLCKRDGDWKICTQITHDPETFSSNAQTVEASLNASGYDLLAAKKVKDAIEVFKLNVKLNPDSANVYDSLGEAYMLDGDKSEAIRNYEKSISLNPQNENAKTALAKLKNK